MNSVEGFNCKLTKPAHLFLGYNTKLTNKYHSAGVGESKNIQLPRVKDFRIRFVPLCGRI